MPVKKKVAKKRVVKKKAKRKAGQPTSYQDKYNAQVRKLCLLGATDKEIADFFNVSEATINNWKIKYPEFLESIKEGKVLADATVSESLYKRANGYSHAEDKIFNSNGEALVVPTTKHYPPDSTAAIFWLKNRQRDKWRDRQDVDLNPSSDLLDFFNSIKPTTGPPSEREK